MNIISIGVFIESINIGETEHIEELFEHFTQQFTTTFTQQFKETLTTVMQEQRELLRPEHIEETHTDPGGG